ncbi:TIGR00730 family Rossman fold protein [Mesorhizobium sp. ES1-1]|uniref:LOG family protein n=1 Tax=Mesorhizobium sp. ES1-1 TaxID=2876629 RepID=UPI001CCA0C74|nr:TIGR00730 family Rossman fold protein [Mesorhizobium sp. ES1-1]MBZ9676199.1 TIGR00730 family Rossman fold protein [Mesorhizobium sp. ES1-1]
MFGSSFDNSAEQIGRSYPSQRRIGTICVFGGAMLGNDPDHARCATVLGEAIAAAGIRLVYGGGCDGLMGQVAIAAAETGGTVVAITPQFLVERMRMLSPGCQTISVPDMSIRKQLMFDYADAFVALPGGIGTVEELTEVMTLRKLERHCKPLVLANFKGFWSPLLSVFESMSEAGFMNSSTRCGQMVSSTPEAILPLLQRSVSFEQNETPKPVLLPTMPVLRRSHLASASPA